MSGPPGIVVGVLETCQEQVQAMLPTFSRVLDDAERARASRFLRLRDARDYIVAHGACRMLLGQVLCVPPSLLRFATLKPRGKPVLAWPAQAAVDFNLSHTHELVMCAVALQPCSRDEQGHAALPVGVDCEDVRAPIEDASLDSYCSDAEIRALRRRPAHARHALWTQKEALAKAFGEGLALDLRSLRIAPCDEGEVGNDGEVGGVGGHPDVVGVAPGMGEASAWRLRHWRPTARHVATLAYRHGSGESVRIEHVDVLHAVA